MNQLLLRMSSSFTPSLNWIFCIDDEVTFNKKLRYSWNADHVVPNQCSSSMSSNE